MRITISNAYSLVLLFASLGCSMGWAATNVPQNPIPVDDAVTIAKCGGCHQRSDDGVMRRISYMRTTPEVWEQAIKRMVRLAWRHSNVARG